MMNLHIALLPAYLILAWCIYNLAKSSVEDYGWRFLGSAILMAALASAWMFYWILK